MSTFRNVIEKHGTFYPFELHRSCGKRDFWQDELQRAKKRAGTCCHVFMRWDGGTRKKVCRDIWCPIPFLFNSKLTLCLSVNIRESHNDSEYEFLAILCGKIMYPLSFSHILRKPPWCFRRVVNYKTLKPVSYSLINGDKERRQVLVSQLTH